VRPVSTAPIHSAPYQCLSPLTDVAQYVAHLPYTPHNTIAHSFTSQTPITPAPAHEAGRWSAESPRPPPAHLWRLSGSCRTSGGTPSRANACKRCARFHAVSDRHRVRPTKVRPTKPTPIPTKSVGYGRQRIGGSISPLSLSLSLSFSLSLYIHTHTHNIYTYIKYMYIYIRPEVSAGAAISAAAAAASIIPPLGSEIRISVNRDITQVKETQCRGVQKNVEVKETQNRGKRHLQGSGISAKPPLGFEIRIREKTSIKVKKRPTQNAKETYAL
jgi:hypothetical protein